MRQSAVHYSTRPTVSLPFAGGGSGDAANFRENRVMDAPGGRASGLSVPGIFAATRTTDIDSAVAMIKAVAEHTSHVRVLDPASAGFDVATATFGAHGADRIRI